MRERIENCRQLSDSDLIASLKCLVADERRTLVDFLIHLGEFNSRRLQEKSPFPSLFLYCTRELRYSEGEAYYRAHAATAARLFPRILEMIESGDLSLTTA